MVKMSEEVKKAVGECKPALVATASQAGKPNVSAKGSLRVLDDDHLVFVNTRSPGTLANLQENPQVGIICLNPATRSGCRVAGRCEIYDKGPLFEQLSQEYAARNMTIKHVVKVAVDDSYAFKF